MNPYSCTKLFRVTLPPWLHLEDVVSKWEEHGESSDLVAMVRDVYQYIDQQKELGASVKDLKVRPQEVFAHHVQSTDSIFFPFRGSPETAELCFLLVD